MCLPTNYMYLSLIVKNCVKQKKTHGKFAVKILNYRDVSMWRLYLLCKFCYNVYFPIHMTVSRVAELLNRSLDQWATANRELIELLS